MTKRRKNDDDDVKLFSGMFVIFLLLAVVADAHTLYICNKSALLIIMKGDPANKFTISKWINLLVTIVNFYVIFLFVNVTHIQILM